MRKGKWRGEGGGEGDEVGVVVGTRGELSRRLWRWEVGVCKDLVVPCSSHEGCVCVSEGTFYLMKGAVYLSV